MSELPLLAEQAGGILTLTLNRPDKRNALSAAMIDALHDALDRADLDASVAVVVLRGAGADFCAGADLAELLASADRSPAENEQDALRLGTVFGKIRSLPKPVLAVVRGRALAGGAGLASACDIVLASDAARFGYPEIQRGFVPAMVMTILRRLAGERSAFELAATGRTVDAAEALRLGLVSRVAPDAALDAIAAETAAALAAAGPSAMALTKRLFYELDGLGFDDGIALGARVNAAARATPEFRDALRSFLKK